MKATEKYSIPERGGVSEFLHAWLALGFLLFFLTPAIIGCKSEEILESNNTKNVLADKTTEVPAENVLLAPGSIVMGKVYDFQISPNREMDSATISSLDRMFVCWTADSSLIIVIEGHTSNTGLPKDQDERAMANARIVRDYLFKQGVPSGNMQTRGFGARQPLVSNTTAEGRAKNNRVAVRLIHGK